MVPASCVDTQYPSDVVAIFTCAGDHLCPAGFRCSSDYCIPNDAADLPTLLARSENTVLPVMHNDPDRGGVMACWTRFEEQQQPNSAVYAAFLTPDGTVHSTTVIGSFDTRNSDALLTCAPVPGSGGKIVVGAWVQQYGTASFRFQVWSPNQGDMFNGTYKPLYEERRPVTSATYADAFTGAVVGNEAWFPLQQPIDSTAYSHTPPYQITRIRFDANSVMTGVPVRELTVMRTPQAFLESAAFYPSDDNTGAWLYMNGAWAEYGFSSASVPVTPFSTTLPFSNRGFGQPLHPRGSTGAMGPQEDLALLWRDSVEAPPDRNTYRLAWMSTTTAMPNFNVTIGPRLPFSPIVTPSPGAFSVGDTLYVFGSPADGVSIDPAPWDAGAPEGGTADAAADASTDDAMAALDAAPNPDSGVFSAMTRGALTMYSIPWNAVDTMAFTPIKVIPRALGAAITPTVRARLMPDGAHFALLWVDFLPADAVGHGARYAIYMQQFAITQ